MTETLHLKACPICSSSLSIVHDKIADELTVRPENLPPLAKDCMEIVATYKRLKGLGAEWQRSHGARGIVYAAQMIRAAGPLGGAQDRCLGLLAWLKESGRDFDLGTVASHFGEYAAHLAAKNIRARCLTCGESFAGVGNDCGRHE